jgi:hypothetical protein
MPEAGVEGSGGRDRRVAQVLASGEHPRHLAVDPFRREQGLVGEPHQPRRHAQRRAGLSEEPLHRERRGRANGVEDARGSGLDEPEHERREVAHVDVLPGVGALTRHQHVATLGQAHGPVREPVRGVARAGNVRGAHDQPARAEGVPDDRLARRLARAEGLRAISGIGRLGVHGIGLDEAATQVWVVHPGRRREEVAAGGGQASRRQADPGRIGGRVVDDGVPAAPPERLELAVPVADQPFDAGRQIRLPPSAREDRHTVPALDREPHQVGSDEARAAQHEDRERGRTGARRPACRGGSDDGGRALQELTPGPRRTPHPPGSMHGSRVGPTAPPRQCHACPVRRRRRQPAARSG